MAAAFAFSPPIELSAPADGPGLAGLDLPLPRSFVHLADSVRANPR
jgi:hypothetical protein